MKRLILEVRSTKEYIVVGAGSWWGREKSGKVDRHYGRGEVMRKFSDEFLDRRTIVSSNRYREGSYKETA